MNQDIPEECDNCGREAPLVRFEHYGPGHNVDWLCPYCLCDFSHGKSDVVKSIAAMLNVFENRIRYSETETTEVGGVGRDRAV